MKKNLLSAALVAAFGAAYAANALADCSKLIQGVVTALDPVNQRVTVQHMKETPVRIPTSNATTIKEAPGFAKAPFSDIGLHDAIRVCTDEKGFATDITFMAIPTKTQSTKANGCAKLTQGVITALDEVNKRVTVQHMKNPPVNIPTSNATKIAEAPGFEKIDFSGVAVGQAIRICTDDKGFATDMTVMNLKGQKKGPAPK
jgi:hypothetical protein